MENARIKNIIFSIVFLVSIALPFPIFILANGGFSSENIKTIQKENPSTSIFNAINKDFKSKYGMRESYLQSHNDIKYTFLNESAIPKKVVVGEEGWFYIGNGSSNSIYETLKATTFNHQEKEKVLDNFRTNQLWLDSMGISYFTCVAPNKMSVYPEFYYSGKLEGNSKFEDLRQYLSENNWDLIDLKSKILEKKDSLRLYHKTDTHWNDDGAYLGYLQLIESLHVKFSKILPVKLSEFKKVEMDSVGMDLSFMLGLQNVEKRIVYKNDNSDITELDRRYKVPVEFSHEDWEYEIRYKNKNGLPFKVMLVRDSFSRAWLKYLKETFAEVVLIWDWKLRKDMVEKEKPDILIQEIVERDIESFLE
jgi:hypothetical protein